MTTMMGRRREEDDGEEKTKHPSVLGVQWKHPAQPRTVTAMVANPRKNLEM